MTTKVHGTSYAGEHLTGGLDYFLIQSILDFTPDANKDPTDASQILLDLIVSTINTKAQPVIQGAVVTTTGADVTIFVGGSGTGTIYSMQIAVEHVQTWTAATLQAAIIATGSFTTSNMLVTAKTF